MSAPNRRARLRPAIVAVLHVLLLGVLGGTARAQDEDVEPHIVGARGVTSIGVSGFLDKRVSSDDTVPLNATLQVDVTRFLTARLAVRGGVIGTARFGIEEDDADVEAPALFARAGALFFWTPQKMASVYTGTEYRAQLTARAAHDAGSVFAVGGVEAALSSRTGVFLEGGYGIGLSRGEDERRQTRLVGVVGFRIKL